MRAELEPRGGRSPRRRRDEAAPQGAGPEADRTIEREELDVAKRIQGRFADVERRQLETLERQTDQAAGRFAEAAALQFDTAVKSAREDAARRLARELDRAVHMFAREAESVLAERLAQVADSGTQRVGTASPGNGRPGAAARRIHQFAPQTPGAARARAARACAGSRTKQRRSGRRSTMARSSPGARTRRSRPAAELRGPILQLPQAGFVFERTNQPALPMPEIAEPVQSERERIAGWRLHVLIEAGYPVHLAERLAHSEADLHRAVELVRQGCDATVAAEILCNSLKVSRLSAIELIGRRFQALDAARKFLDPVAVAERAKARSAAGYLHRPSGPARHPLAAWRRESRGRAIWRPQGLQRLRVQSRCRRVACAPADGLGRGRGHGAPETAALAERLLHAQGPG